MRTRSLIVSILFIALPSIGAATPTTHPIEMPAFETNFRILFQGDSITDMNRGRTDDPNHILGHSYAFLIAARYGSYFPERHLTFINRGISGNAVNDLAARWKTDAIDLKPDILSILVGVNDINHGVSAQQYQKRYDQLLSETLHALPKVQLVLCEPFGLPVGKRKPIWETYKVELAQEQAVVAKLAVKYRALFVPLQKVFDDACERAPADYWIWDGVHPTYSGQQLIADQWVKTVNEFWQANHD